MEIQSTNQSAFYAGLKGFQTAAEDTNRAATYIATQATVKQVDPVQGKQNEVSSPQEYNGLTDAIVALNVAETQAQASAKVIKTADEMLGSIIDTKV